GTKMLGNVPGDQTVNLWPKPGVHGILPNHLLTTGLHYLYEGITIATIQPNQVLKPLCYGHADNLVAAYYDSNGKRAILDGGFTRLYYKWDTAGEGQFGSVYRAEQPLLEREAVVKILRENHRANQQIIQRFMREARLAARLDHPYAAHIYAFGAEPDGM